MSDNDEHVYGGAEAVDAVHWVSDEAGDQPYATQYQLVSAEMFDAAIHPGDILLNAASRMRAQVDEFVTDNQLTARGLATLTMSWVQPIAESPRVTRTEDGEP